jgi:histidine phosphotransferase ChpT
MRARIEFFRVAFGTYQAGQMMDAPKVQSTADAIYTAPRFDLHWYLENAIDLTWAQVIYMGLMCVERQLTLGGTIDVTANTNHIKITATSERPTVAHPGWERLSSDLDELPAPADVQFHLLPNVADAYGFAVEFNHRETITTLNFRRG